MTQPNSTAQKLRCLIGWHDWLYVPPEHSVSSKKKLAKGTFVCRKCGHVGT